MAAIFRVLHARVGDRGYTCQVKKWWGWKSLGIRQIRKYSWHYDYSKKPPNWDDTKTYEVDRDEDHGPIDDAKRRLENEIKKYKAEQTRRRELAEFKPKVIEEWP